MDLDGCAVDRISTGNWVGAIGAARHLRAGGAIGTDAGDRSSQMKIIAAVLIISCGYPRECFFSCRLELADGGCRAGAPLCTTHCGGPICPDGYGLVQDAGACEPI